MAKLLISLPTGDVSHELTGDIVTIGRTPDNKIAINHHSVSAHHAKLQLVNGNYRLRDLDSTNRTCVNNIPVSDAELTGSCFLRFGTIECVFKTENPNSSDQLQSQLGELQRQLESLMKARDLSHQQNTALLKEREAAQHASEEALEAALSNLAEANRKIEAFEARNAATPPQANESRENVLQIQKKLDAIGRERDSLLESNRELKGRLETLTVQFQELQMKAQSATATVQQKAAARVKEEMGESVDEYEEEEELESVGQKTAAAGNAGRGTPGAPLLASWLNRGAKRKNPDDSSDKPTNITSMPLPEAPASQVPPPAHTPAPAVPVLRIIPPPSANANGAIMPGSTAGAGALRHRAAAAAAANAAPSNPEIKPAWELLNGMRRSLHYFLRHQDELKVLEEMEQNAHCLTEMSLSDLLRPIHELSTAVEALIRDMHTSPKNINASTLRTVGQSIDFLATLLDETNLSRIKDVSNARIFAVDDDEGILDTIIATMEMAHLNITTSGQPTAGLTILSEQDFDLILLDVGLPEMNGMDMCSRIRAMTNHQKTPIVFLTGEATVQNRVQSTLNGGNDLIGKPFSVLELAVKALTWIFKGQLGLV